MLVHDLKTPLTVIRGNQPPQDQLSQDQVAVDRRSRPPVPVRAGMPLRRKFDQPNRRTFELLKMSATGAPDGGGRPPALASRGGLELQEVALIDMAELVRTCARISSSSWPSAAKTPPRRSRWRRSAARAGRRGAPATRPRQPGPQRGRTTPGGDDPYEGGGVGPGRAAGGLGWGPASRPGQGRHLQEVLPEGLQEACRERGPGAGPLPEGDCIGTEGRSGSRTPSPRGPVLLHPSVGFRGREKHGPSASVEQASS